jgi:DNA-binding MarR family transcriptional regulator
MRAVWPTPVRRPHPLCAKVLAIGAINAARRIFVIVTTNSGGALESAPKRALRAYLGATALAEPIQTHLWEAAGLTLAQLALLQELRRHGPLSASRLAQAIGRSSASVTRLLDRLEERGMVSRHRDARDRRSVEVHLEEEGLRAMGEIRVLHDSALAMAMERMTESELDSLERSLLLLVERTRALAQDDEEVRSR